MRDLTDKYARLRNECFLPSTHASQSVSSLSGPLLDARSYLAGVNKHDLESTLRPEWTDMYYQVEADTKEIKEAGQCGRWCMR